MGFIDVHAGSACRGAAEVADQQFVRTVGSAALDSVLTFRALTVTVDNPTNQWVRLDGIGVYVPQYTLGATYQLPGTARAQASFNAPPGQVQPPTIAGQAMTITFYDLARVPTPGVGMLGGRAPYYDRNPLSIRQFAAATVNANAATAALWTYTVPAGRRAYIEACFVSVTITTAYANDNANIETYIAAFNSSGGGGTQIIEALVTIGTAIGTDARTALGGNMELQSGESVQAQYTDGRAAGAGASFHMATMKATEFDV